MFCEVEFLAVGDGTRPGDAIIVRYGDPNHYGLMVVDGGTANCGESLVAHLKKHFGQFVALEHVVLTHSDADHASGLREVLREKLPSSQRRRTMTRIRAKSSSMPSCAAGRR
jgi:glyoxylase-like metal-dependent hydrolase (beta-lactamase superfamily II)